jgi:hypothetical protein
MIERTAAVIASSVSSSMSGWYRRDIFKVQERYLEAFKFILLNGG